MRYEALTTAISRRHLRLAVKREGNRQPCANIQRSALFQLASFSVSALHARNPTVCNSLHQSQSPLFTPLFPFGSPPRHPSPSSSSSSSFLHHPHPTDPGDDDVSAGGNGVTDLRTVIARKKGGGAHLGIGSSSIGNRLGPRNLRVRVAVGGVGGVSTAAGGQRQRPLPEGWLCRRGRHQGACLLLPPWAGDCRPSRFVLRWLARVCYRPRLRAGTRLTRSRTLSGWPV